MIQTAWAKKEIGWYTLQNHGSIRRSPDNKWYWYPPPEWWKFGLGEIFKRVGPFETLREAKDSAERSPLYDATKA